MFLISKFLKINIHIFNSASKDPLSYLVEGATKNVCLGYIKDEKHYVALPTLVPQEPKPANQLKENRESSRKTVNCSNEPAETKDTVDVDFKHKSMVNQIIYLALLESNGNRDKFVAAYKDLAIANNMEAVNIPEPMFRKTTLPCFITNLIKGGVNDIQDASERQLDTAKILLHAKKVDKLSTSLPLIPKINQNDSKISNTDRLSISKNSKSAKIKKKKHQTKDCRHC